MKPVVFVDMDMTMNRLWERFISLFNEQWGGSRHLDREELVVYPILESMRLDPEEHNFEEVYNDIFENPAIWTQCAPWEGAREALEGMNKEYKLFFATTPWPTAPDCPKLKWLWMEEHFPFVEPQQMIFIHDKGLLEGHVLVDDSPSNLRAFRHPTIAFDYPYNRAIQTVGRFHDWSEGPGEVDRVLSIVPTVFVL